MSVPPFSLADTPVTHGYRMPAEWEPHAATWLSWPHREQTWPGHMQPIPHVWAALARTLSAFEPVHILVSECVRAEAESLVGHVAGVHLHAQETNDAWMRDHGPVFLVGPAGASPALVNWDFNSWGGKYLPYDADNAVPTFITELLGYRRYDPHIILEGGSIDVNGRGSLLTSEVCLLNSNRNPRLGRGEIEATLHAYTAARNVIWLGEGIAGDDTDGHIDELARFVSPRVVVAAVEQDPADVNYAPLQDNLRRLQLARDEEGRPFEIIPLVIPSHYEVHGVRVPASYCNFYIANGVLIVPQFGVAIDSVALETLGRCFAERHVVGLDARDLIFGRGAYHCITQQQPRLA